jgi:Ca2+-binding RTX toxin-like protein
MVTTPTLWKGLTQVNTSDELAQLDGQVIGLPDGGYIIVWSDNSGQHNPVGSAVVGQVFNALGEKVGDETFLSGSTVGSASEPSVTLLADGTIAVAFVDNFAADEDILVRRFDTNLELVQGDTIDVGANQTVTPAIAAFANGSYLVTYTVGDSGINIVGRIVTASGLVGAEFDILDDGDDSDDSEGAALTNGNVVVVFTDEDGGADDDIKFAIVSVAGAFVAEPATVDGAGETATEDDPNVAALKGGGFVVVWTDNVAGNQDVRATIFDNAGNVVNSNSGVGILVNTSTTGNQNEADVLALADGDFVVTWEDDAADLVRGQRFDALGNKVGDVFTVKSLVSTDSPDAALLSDGRFAYAVGGADADGTGVFTSIWDSRTSPISGTNAGETLTSRVDGATVNGLAGNDTLLGFASDDTLNGDSGDDTVSGGGGNDTLNGGRGNDVLSGRIGNDTLRGGKGRDLLSGNVGQDIFDFNSARESGKGGRADVIFDFAPGQTASI